MTRDEELRHIEKWDHVARTAHNEAIRLAMFEIERALTVESLVPAGVLPSLLRRINALKVSPNAELRPQAGQFPPVAP